MKILSIDWDYITGDCSCNSHAHCGYCLNIRTSKRRGEANRVQPCWQKIKANLLKKNFSSKVPIYVAECHADIMKLVNEHGVEVLDFDSHYDNYDEEELRCGNWIYHLELQGGSVQVRPDDVSSDAVFICRSAPWTPDHMDKEFYNFVRVVSDKVGSVPIFIGHRKVYLKTNYHSHSTFT